MNSAEIKSRIAELVAQIEAHDARDLDAELLEAMQAGGDVDAVEDAQLEAQRQARRLRVERQALEQALPDALKREAMEQAQALIEGFPATGKDFEKDLIRLEALEAKTAQLITSLVEVSLMAEKTRGEAGKLLMQAGVEGAEHKSVLAPLDLPRYADFAPTVARRLSRAFDAEQQRRLTR